MLVVGNPLILSQDEISLVEMVNQILFGLEEGTSRSGRASLRPQLCGVEVQGCREPPNPEPLLKLSQFSELVGPGNLRLTINP